jgi:hypothetical protein
MVKFKGSLPYGRVEKLNPLIVFMKGMKKRHGDRGRSLLIFGKMERKPLVLRRIVEGMEEEKVNRLEEELKQPKIEEWDGELRSYLKDVFGVEEPKGMLSFNIGDKKELHHVIIDAGDHYIHMVRRCNKACETYYGVVVEGKPPKIELNRYLARISFQGPVSEAEYIENEYNSVELARRIWENIERRYKIPLSEMKGWKRKIFKIVEQLDRRNGIFLKAIYSKEPMDHRLLRDLLRKVE